MGNIWEILLNTTCNFFLHAAVVVFLHCFYDSAFRWNKKKALLFLASAVANSLLVYATWDNALLAELISYGFMAINAVIFLYDYKGKKFRGFLRIAVYSTLATVFVMIYAYFIGVCVSQNVVDFFRSEVFGVYAMEAASHDLQLIVNIFGAIFLGIVFFSLYPLYRAGVAMRCGKREQRWLLTIMAVSLLIAVPLLLLFRDDVVVLRYALAALGILWFTLFPIFIYSTTVSKYYRNRNAVQEGHIQAELAHFQQYQQTQMETSRFRHDIQNNLACLNDMLQQGKTEMAAEYVKDLLKTVAELSRQYVTGDALLDSIVSIKAQTMAQNQIQFELDGVLAGGLPWKPMDVCNVFANALDNAIEACQKVDPEKRKISMIIKSTPQYWFVTIENSVAKAVDTTKLFLKNGGYTSKSNAANHGIGTYNMKYTVESYNAMLKANCTDELFTLELMIDKSHSQ